MSLQLTQIPVKTTPSVGALTLEEATRAQRRQELKDTVREQFNALRTMGFHIPSRAEMRERVHAHRSTPEERQAMIDYLKQSQEQYC